MGNDTESSNKIGELRKRVDAGRQSALGGWTNYAQPILQEDIRTNNWLVSLAAGAIVLIGGAFLRSQTILHGKPPRILLSLGLSAFLLVILLSVVARLAMLWTSSNIEMVRFLQSQANSAEDIEWMKFDDKIQRLIDKARIINRVTLIATGGVYVLFAIGFILISIVLIKIVMG